MHSRPVKTLLSILVLFLLLLPVCGMASAADSRQSGCLGKQLLAAIKRGDQQEVQTLLDQGADIESAD